MKRLPALVTALALVALVGGFVAYVTVGTGAPAFSVDGHSVSQSDVDDELRALADNAAFARLIRQTGSAPLAPIAGSITSGYAAGWLSLRVAQVFVDETVARRRLAVTAADRQEGEGLAVQLLGSEQVVRTLPSSLRSAIRARFARIAVLQRSLLASPSAALRDAALRRCPSHRFVAHILVATLAEAQAIQAQLAAGADFATLARQRSTDRASAAQGGDLGCLDSQSFVAPFQQAAQTQPVGSVSSPVQTQYGFHLILVRDRPSTADLASVALDQVLGRARGAHVTLDPRYGSWDRRQGRVVPPAAATAGTATPSPTG
ncbi:MAG TPA: peptidylprolyl isomerase [Acidimicrobiia bacterium]|nr:peptidylprolyl isomerase [Acidimicrobiia bacterium]HEV3451089.1 peptidylprolyl isomerase [Acidimicrobiia bacterium]